jgi:restriction endonuclease Mrr
MAPIGQSYPAFSEDTSMSPKEFLLEKQPRTDVERIACLAYYLTHYRDTPHFKTLDLNKLNTEAAQPKFSNATVSANNAQKRGYLVPSTKGHRQISAAGEQFVRALPDREAAKAAMTALRPRRRNKRKSVPRRKRETKQDN